VLDDRTPRAVTHLDVDEDGVARAAQCLTAAASAEPWWPS
jgi:hypothetical protein